MGCAARAGIAWKRRYIPGVKSARAIGARCSRHQNRLMLLKSSDETTSDETTFCSGVCGYSNRPATEKELTNRMFVPVTIGSVTTEMVLDTGGSWLVLDPSIAHSLGLVDDSTARDEMTLNVRGRPVRGQLQR